MVFISMRDFRTQTSKVWEKLTGDEDIVIMNNGRPKAFLVGIPDGHFDEMLTGIRKTKAQIKPKNQWDDNYIKDYEPYLNNYTPEEKEAALDEIRRLCAGVDGNFDVKEIRAERRAEKHEYSD